MFTSKSEFKFNLGSIVKDKITGFEGVVMSRTQWLNACNVYGVLPQQLKDGKVADKEHFDEPQLELVQDDVFKPKQKTGGPAHSVPMTNR